MAQELWDRLRATGLHDLAPVLFEHGVREVRDIMPNAGALLLSGVEAWKLEAIVRGRLETTLALPAGRQDHPVAAVRQKASWAAALEAALPQNRQAALDDLQAAVLAATTRPAVESRLKAWRELSAAWERPPFPVNTELVRCVGASLRAGGYHSCSQYFSAATSHQLRTLALPIGEETRFVIRDTIRAIKRGLGPASLKDAFDFEVLRELVKLEESLRAFDVRDLAATVDLCIVCAWYMLREIEVSNARAHHLYLTEPDSVHLLLPVSKTESQGSLTVRTYVCVCRARREPLCPFHSAKRHLERLRLAGVDSSASNYLFPGQDGEPLKKFQVVQLIERVLRAAGVETTRPDEAGRQAPRFSGHTLRVSGTQYLAALNVPLAQIQLQGRWSSRAIDRYVQLAPLLRLPQNVRAAAAVGALPAQRALPQAEVMVLSDEEPVTPPAHRRRRRRVAPAATSPSPPPMVHEPPAASALGPGTSITLEQVRDEIAKAIPPAKEHLIVQPRRRVAHSIGVPEAHNEVHRWRTTCGWGYGWSGYYRIQADSLGPELRRCRRCFPDETNQSASSSSSSSSSGSSSS